MDVHNVTAPPTGRDTANRVTSPHLKHPVKEGRLLRYRSRRVPPPNKTSSETNTPPETPKRRQSESFSITNPYVMHEVQGDSKDDQADFKDPDAHAQIMHKSATVNAIKTAPSQNLSAPFKKNSGSSGELKSISPLYQVDKSALYPSNFKPFPKRNAGKRKAQGK